MRKVYIYQDIVSYDDYIKMNTDNKNRLVLPTLIDITNSDINPQNVESFYYKSFLSYQVDRQLLEISPDELIEQERKGTIRVAGYIDLNNKKSKVEVNPGNLDMNSGGFTLKKGILWSKKETYYNLDDINHEVIKKKVITK